MTATTVSRFNHFATVAHDELTAPGQATAPVKLSGRLAVQATGTETTGARLYVERSTIDPASGSANWTGAFPMNPPGAESGIPVNSGVSVVAYYDEPAVAWWRVVAEKLTGGPILVSISGGGA